MAQNTASMINDNQLDTLVYCVSNTLAGYGIKLDSDLLSDLNDTLENFLTDKCDIEVSEQSKIQQDQKIVRIEFDVQNGIVTQSLRLLNDQYDEAAIIEGLRTGSLVTTTWQEQGVTQYLDVTATAEHVAIIESQEVDAEYVDYR